MLVCVGLFSFLFLSFLWEAHFILILQRQMSRRNHHDFQDSPMEEAIESQQHIEEESILPQSEESGQDLIENAEKDYERIVELDEYERESVDAEEIVINPEARRKAEKELARRDKIFHEDEQLDNYMEDDDDQAELRRRRHYYSREDQDEQIDERRYIDPEQCKGMLKKWIEEEHTKKYIKKKFLRFLKQFTSDQKTRIYYERLKGLLHENRTSLNISYIDFKDALPTLAVWLGLEPQYLLPQLNAVLYIQLCKMSPSFKNIVPEVYIKFFDLPLIDRIPDLKVENIGKLIKVKGVITVRSEVFNQLKKAVYKCYRCGEPKGPYYLHQRQSIQLGSCRACQSSGPFIMEKNKSVYRNFQRLVIQQSPSQVKPGRIPRTKEVIVTGDNVDITKPGEQVQIIGTFSIRYQVSMNIKQGFPVFYTFIEANSIKKHTDINSIDTNQEKTFMELAKRPDFAELLYNSIAPSIYGHYEVKQALAFALFGGNEKNIVQKGHRVRGDINVLLLGDPGIAKSQFLKSLQKIAPRCVYATGKGASAVGLTATVKQDNQTGEWRLEAGAMVLADKGLCLIDQFDKMNEHDRTSIHEAMQQQTISISKAGIVAQLRARCSVVAAANPLQGQYNQTLNFADNVNLSDPILSRFDIVKVIKDRPNPDLDYHLSTFVINIHMENHPYSQEYEQQLLSIRGKEKQKEIIDQEVLKSFIRYAKEKFTNRSINEKCAQMIKDFYKKLREISITAGGISITPRHLESCIRVCEAHAKMHLRQETTRVDAQVAIKAMLKSFTQTQKHATAKKIEKEMKFYM